MTIFNEFPVTFPNGAFNELYSPDGGFRQPYRLFVETAEAEGADRLRFYAEQTNRLFLSEMPSAGSEKPLTHGFIPYFLSLRDFELLQAGLIQRARVLNAALADVYGPQNLLKKNVLPPEILFSSKTYQKVAKKTTW